MERVDPSDNNRLASPYANLTLDGDFYIKKFLSAFVFLWSFATNLIFLFSIRAAKRATVVSTFRFFNSKCNAAQIQYVLGKSENTYKTWAKRNDLPITIEKLVDDADLYWIGPKRTDRVVLCFPGTPFLLLGR